MPNRHCKMYSITIVLNLVKTKPSLRTIWCDHILIWYNINSFFVNRFIYIILCLVILKRCPLNVNLNLRINHMCAQGKCIYICCYSINWIGSNITNLISFCDSTCYHSWQELCLIKTGVVGSYISMWCIDRTIEYLYIWIFNTAL